MNYDIFDEQYYLSQYPWVKPAIDAGIVKSGLEHFEKFGQAAGLTKVSRYFDEATYLAGNPEIAPFVRTVNPNAPFATGLDHFIQFGYEEGRTRVSPEYDEAFYVANNRDLLPFIQNGTFKNGYQHFVKFGAKERRFGTSFFETEYLEKNPDIVPFVNSGTFTTGREHYMKFGQFEPSRSATFVGTSGNDIVPGIGTENVEIIGVKVSVEYAYGARSYDSGGSNEFDTLIGGIGRDKFVLGDYQDFARNLPSPLAELYIGPGFATIQNFTKGQDSIQFFGSLAHYILFPINNNRDLAIQTERFDTVAVIEGGGNLSLNLLPGSSPTKFLLG
jgi:Ca2+-binding RTX toxin-like protein